MFALSIGIHVFVADALSSRVNPQFAIDMPPLDSRATLPLLRHRWQ